MILGSDWSRVIASSVQPFDWTDRAVNANMIINILLLENLTHNDHHNITSPVSNEFLLIFLDRRQQVMTIIGVIANIGTSITLIKNGQVGTKLDLLCCQKFLY